jgi:hypothetical protein
LLEAGDVVDAALAAVVAVRGVAAAAEASVAARLNPGYARASLCHRPFFFHAWTVSSCAPNRYFWLDTSLQPGVATMVFLLQVHGLRLAASGHGSSSSSSSSGSAPSDAYSRVPVDTQSELKALPSSLFAAAASAVGAWRGVDASGDRAPSVGSGKLAYYRAAGARHNEKAWAARMARPLLHLYGPDI